MSLLYIRHSLQARRDWRGGPVKRTFAASKYLFRCVLHWRHQSAWLHFLRETPRMSAMLAHDPRLHERPMHEYINRKLPLARRYEIIESHYRHLFAHWPARMVDRIYLEGETSLGRFTLKNGSFAELQLRRPLGRGREGELALYLLDAEGRPLSSMIFTLADGGRTVLIGCLQGAAAGLGLGAVREFTKQAHGLRPKNLLLSMLYALAQASDASQILGVGNDAHPFSRHKGKIKADYDGFWTECLARPRPDGFHVLPLQEPTRDESLVESKHRSAFRKREILRHAACSLLIRAIRGIADEAANTCVPAISGDPTPARAAAPRAAWHISGTRRMHR